MLTGSSGSKHKVILYARCLSVNRPVCIRIELRLESKTLAICRECIFGNVEPHAEGSSLHAVCYITENNYFIIGVEENIVSPACKISIGVIKSPCKSIVTVSYLTTIFGRRHKSFTTNIIAKLTCKRIRTNESVVNSVILRPLFSFFEAHESRFVAVFEVPNNLGALTEFDGICKYDFTISDGYIDTCNASIIGCSKFESVENTGFGIGDGYIYSIRINVYVCFACHCNDGQGDCANLICSRIRNYGRGCRKFKYCGVSYSDSLSTNNVAIGKNLNINCTGFAVGNKCTSCNSTERCIGKCPGNICRHIHSVTVGIDCFCTKGISSLGSKNIIISFNVDYIKLTCGSNVGSDKDTVCGRSLCTVTRNGTHFKVFFTNTLRNESRGSATVTVSSPLTAKSKHNFAFFIRGKTNGVVCATTIVHNENESTVFLNTNHGTSSIVRTTRFLGINKCAILNYHGEGYTYCVEKSTVCEILFNVSLVIRLNVTGNIAFCILKYIEDGRGSIQNCTAGSYVFMCVTDPLTIVDKYTGRV